MLEYHRVEVTVLERRLRNRKSQRGYVGLITVTGKVQPVDVCCDTHHETEGDARACGLRTGRRIAELRGFSPPS